MAGFNPNKFIKSSNECTDHSVDQTPVVVEQTKKKSTKKEKTTITVPAATTDSALAAQAATNSMTYIQSDLPYMNAYVDTTKQLDDSINQLNVIGGELMSELMTVKSSKTLKNKYNYINDMTATLTSVINTKISAIKEKNKTINDVNNLELKRVKELKINTSEEDDNTKIMNLYDAFINTPVGMGAGGQSLLGPSISDMTVHNGMPTMNHMSIGNDQQAWQQSLNPAENRMVLEAKGAIETVVMYDEASGNRWFEVVDKNTRQPVPNVEKPDNTYIYELDINIRGGYAKDVHLNTTYPLIVVNGGDQSILEY